MPRLVSSWTARLRPVEAADVGPPWLVTTSGGSSPSGARKAGVRGAVEDPVGRATAGRRELDGLADRDVGRVEVRGPTCGAAASRRRSRGRSGRACGTWSGAATMATASPPRTARSVDVGERQVEGGGRRARRPGRSARGGRARRRAPIATIGPVAGERRTWRARRPSPGRRTRPRSPAVSGASRAPSQRWRPIHSPGSVATRSDPSGAQRGCDVQVAGVAGDDPRRARACRPRRASATTALRAVPGQVRVVPAQPGEARARRARAAATTKKSLPVDEDGHRARVGGGRRRRAGSRRSC